LNPQDGKIPSKIKELTGNSGVDVAIEAVGIESTLKDCLASIRYKGKIIVQGIFTDRVQMHMLGFVTRETTMIGTNHVNFPLALSWIASNGVQPESIITKIVPLEQIAMNGFEALTQKTKEEIKILIKP
jgi:threonine dehydrogenase-like Zn-dependent dehydrogenase